MVLCDNPSCKHGWFHFLSVNLKSTPVGFSLIVKQLSNNTSYVTLTVFLIAPFTTILTRPRHNHAETI